MLRSPSRFITIHVCILNSLIALYDDDDDGGDDDDDDDGDGDISLDLHMNDVISSSTQDGTDDSTIYMESDNPSKNARALLVLYCCGISNELASVNDDDDDDDDGNADDDKDGGDECRA